jgi:hypothetical protein
MLTLYVILTWWWTFLVEACNVEAEEVTQKRKCGSEYAALLVRAHVPFWPPPNQLDAALRVLRALGTACP